MVTNKLIMSILSGSVSPGALASDTAIIMTSGFDTEMVAPFLVKQVQFQAGWHDVDPTDGLIIGLAQGDASVGEISVAINTAALDPGDVGAASLVTKKKIIFWETLTYLSGLQNTVNMRASIGGGKGIPLAEDHGVTVFIYNPSFAAALTTGSIVHFAVTLKGVWLGS